MCLKTAMQDAKDLQTKLKATQAEKEQALERTNSTNHSLGVERSLSDPLLSQLERREKRIKELDEYSLNLTNRAARLELEKGEAVQTAFRAQVNNFHSGYNDTLREAKKLRIDFKQMLLNLNIYPTLDPEPKPAAGDRGPRAAMRLGVLPHNYVIAGI